MFEAIGLFADSRRALPSRRRVDSWRTATCIARRRRSRSAKRCRLAGGCPDGAPPLGDGLRLDEDAARTAIETIASAMGTDVETAALGIVRVSNSAIVRALRRVTVERGIDGGRTGLPGRAKVRLRRDDAVVVESGGGGGHGRPEA